MKVQGGSAQGGFRNHVRFADLAGHLTSTGMALQYSPVDIPIRTHLVLLLAIVMAGGVLFFPSQGASLSSDSCYSAAGFPRRENTPEPCSVPLALSPDEAPFGGGAVWSLPEQGRAAYIPYERSTPGTSRLERWHVFSSFVALSGNSFCPGILLRRSSVLSAVSILPRGWVSCHVCPRSPPAV